VVFVLTAFINMAGLLMRLSKMSNLTLIFLITMVGMSLSSALAQNSLRPLTASEIRKQMFGTRMTGEYPSGKQWAEQFNTDGTSTYSEDGTPMQGVMTLDGNKLCFTYPQSNQTGGCFEVWRRSKNCFDFYSTPTTVPQIQRRFGQSWDARAWYSNAPGTCVSELIS